MFHNKSQNIPQQVKSIPQRVSKEMTAIPLKLQKLYNKFHSTSKCSTNNCKKSKTNFRNSSQVPKVSKQIRNTIPTPRSSDSTTNSKSLTKTFTNSKGSSRNFRDSKTSSENFILQKMSQEINEISVKLQKFHSVSKGSTTNPKNSIKILKFLQMFHSRYRNSTTSSKSSI